MSVALKGIGKFDAAVKAWFASVETASAAVAVGLARRVFDKVLIESPQYSGDFAANWKVTIDAPASDFNADAVDKKRRGYPDATGINEFTPFKRGDPEAIAYAKAHAAWTPIKLGQSIFISNSAEHDEKYAWQIEHGIIKFRPVNAGAGAVGRRSVAFVGHRFPVIGKSQFEILRRVGA